MANKSKTGMVGKIGKTIVEAVTIDNLIAAVKSEVGQQAVKKISGKIFGIGPNDEALLEKAINFLVLKIYETDKDNFDKKIVEVRESVVEFLNDLEKNGYSRWWFRNVLATMRKGDGPDENQAAMTLYSIIQGKTFEERVRIAGPHLVQKTYLKRAKDGLELIVGEDGKLNFLVDFSRAKNFFLEKTQVISPVFENKPLLLTKELGFSSFGVGRNFNFFVFHLKKKGRGNDYLD